RFDISWIAIDTTTGNYYPCDPGGVWGTAFGQITLTAIDPATLATKDNQTNGSQRSQRVDSAGNSAPAGDTAARAGFTQLSSNGNAITSASRGSSRPIDVEIIDSSGNQIN